MSVYDIAIIGGGPAGLSAAINGRIRNKNLVVFQKGEGSYRLLKAPRVDNYLGFMEVSGSELNQRFRESAESMGVKIKAESVTTVIKQEDLFSILTDKSVYSAKTVIIATGINEKASIRNEENLIGRGVSYCATCDGPLYRGKEVAVLAYTPDAEEEANFLSEICKKVYYLPQYKGRFKLKPEVEIISGKPMEILGTGQVRGLSYGNNEENAMVLNIAGLFIIRRSMPIDQLIAGLELVDGSVAVDRGMRTNIPGVFAAGDCTGKPWQIAKAVGEGQVAALSAVEYLDGLQS